MAWVSGATGAPEVWISTSIAAPVPRTTTFWTRALFGALFAELFGADSCAKIGADNKVAMPSRAPT
jgi:hypothetical protein